MIARAVASQVVGAMHPAPFVTHKYENDWQAALVVVVAGASVHTLATQAAAVV